MCRLISYLEYPHSYAHALKPKLKTIYYNAAVREMPVHYVRAIVTKTLQNPEVKVTDKELQFLSDINACLTSQAIFYRVKNAINCASELMVYVDENNNLLS